MNKAGNCFLEKQNVTPQAVNAVMRYVLGCDPDKMVLAQKREVCFGDRWYRLTVEFLPNGPEAGPEKERADG